MPCSHCHPICLLCTYDSTWVPSQYIPSSAHAEGIALPAANIYAVLPNSSWKTASVYLMLIHNITAFTLHFNPLLYMYAFVLNSA